MTDGFPGRLTQLRARWQADPSSRVFLQLAEEYRHLGRVQEALRVLEAGLKEHPGYLSALVAKGRCLLELGDAEKAREVLERVVQQDATQMVANKLLVRAYLETSEPERAGQRLDLYSLLNDSDPEIEELRRRVVAMSRPPRAADGPRPEESAERSRMDRTETPEGSAAAPGDAAAAAADPRGSPGGSAVFDLGPGEPVRAFAAADDIFGLGASQLPTRPRPAQPVAAPLLEPSAEPAAERASPLSEGPIWLMPRGEGTGAEPFPDPAPEHSRGLYLASLEAERIFWFDYLFPAAGAPGEAAASVAPAGTEAPVAPAEPEAPAAAAEPGATVTLGELYLRQGHLEEAERLFREVVAREPDNAAALAGLARLDRRPAGGRQLHQLPALDAAQLLVGLDDPNAPAAKRKAHLLHSYLTRLRQARRPHVP
jgi:tetratricopeptide (TPR) repeat protein